MARPKRDMKRFTTYLHSYQVEEIKRAVLEKSTPQSLLSANEIVREILDEWIERRKAVHSS